MPTLDEREPMDKYGEAILTNDPIWAAEPNGSIIGFCVRNIGSDNNIGARYAVLAMRNIGIGKHLLDLAKDGCDYITVWAYKLNTKARRFYHREKRIEISREFDESAHLMDIEHRWKR